MNGTESTNLWQLVALTGLVCKLVFLWWARPQQANFTIGRIHLSVLAALILANAVEFATYYDPLPMPTKEYFESYMMRSSYIAYFITIATLVHLVLVAAFDIHQYRFYRVFTLVLYSFTFMGMAIVMFTNEVVTGFEYVPEITIGLPYKGIHGPWYSLYMYMVLFGLLVLIVSLVYGSIRQNSPRKRMRCRWLLFALTPLVMAASAVIPKLLGFYTAPFNATVIMPLASTLFLAITVYATHQHQLFGLELPWSLSWWQKTPFYRRLYRILDEMSRFPNIHGIVERLEDVLNTGVVLLAPNGEVYESKTATLTKMRNVPRTFLESMNRTVVTEELQESDLSLYKALSSHAVSAAIAFYPHHSRSRSVKASGWLLLGHGFGNRSYNLPEKHALEELIAGVAELHDDRIVSLQHQIETQKDAIQILQQRMPEPPTRALRGHEINSGGANKSQEQPLQETAEELLQTVTADILADLDGDRAKVLVFSRDRSFIEQLQKNIPQLDDYVAPYPYVLTKQPIPSVLIYDRREANEIDDVRLCEWLKPAKYTVTVFILGAQGMIMSDIDKHALVVLQNYDNFPSAEELVRQVRNALPRPSATSPMHRTLDNYVAIFETNIIKKTLNIAEWDRRKAARLLGISPNTLYKKIRQYGILRVEKSQGTSPKNDGEDEEKKH